MQLTRERITGAALAILAEYGLADVSMRRVATSLSVAPGALYWHIANKQELIASMAEEIVQELLCGPLPEPARDGAEVVVAAVSQPGSQVQKELETRFAASVRAWLGEAASTSDVRIAARGLLRLTLGDAAVQQAAAQLAQATGADEESDGADEHAAAVAFLLDGLKRSASAGTKLWPHE